MDKVLREVLGASLHWTRGHGIMGLVTTHRRVSRRALWLALALAVVLAVLVYVYMYLNRGALSSP